jgi:hypothetical protein
MVRNPWLPPLALPAITLIRLQHVQVVLLDMKFSALFAQQNFATYNVKVKSTGLYKNAGTFSYLRVFGAGHSATGKSSDHLQEAGMYITCPR